MAPELRTGPDQNWSNTHSPAEHNMDRYFLCIHYVEKYQLHILFCKFEENRSAD